MTAPKAKAAPKIKRPPGLAHGRWLGDLEAERPLSAAEKALIAACALGEPWAPEGWDGERPEKATAANTIRADLIRFLVLGGDADHPVHEGGVNIFGAWISGVLNLHQAQANLQLNALRCHFAETLIFMKASLPEIGLVGSSCPGLRGDGLKIAGDLNLRDGFHAKGEVRLVGAEIGGNLDCNDGRFENPDGKSLHADGVTVKSDLNLNGGFHATGEVRLLGAKIGGDLDCNGGRFENADGTALNADGVTVRDALFLRGARVQGRIDLATASVGTLVDGDTPICWKSGRHYLDGFRYDRIMGFTDAAKRIEWLKLQDDSELVEDFAPQPWEQLITVLREMGHPDAASDVAIAKQEQMRMAGVIVRKGLHLLYGVLAGYGHRPMNAVRAMALVWLTCSTAFYAGGQAGLMGPSSPLIHASLQWESCGAPGELNAEGKQKSYWATQCTLPSEYTTLQSGLYSLDLILPLVDLQQDSDWSPIVSNEVGHQLWWGHGLRWLMWFEILFGWAMSLMLVAVLGRLVDKD